MTDDERELCDYSASSRKQLLSPFVGEHTLVHV